MHGTMAGTHEPFLVPGRGPFHASSSPPGTRLRTEAVHSQSWEQGQRLGRQTSPRNNAITLQVQLDIGHMPGVWGEGCCLLCQNQDVA